MRPLFRLAPLAAVLALGAWTPAAAQMGGQEKAVGALAVALLLLVAIPSLAIAELLVMALLPGPVAAARQVLMRRRLACLAAGAAVLVLASVLVAVLSQAKGIGQLLAVLVIAAVVLGIVLGFPAIGLMAGRAVLETSGRTPTPLASAAWGLVLILFGSLFPVLGWALFVFFCLSALGAVALSLPEMRRPVPLLAEKEPALVSRTDPGDDA